MEQGNKIQILFRKYIDKTLNREELAQLNDILGQKDSQEYFEELLQEHFQGHLKNTAELELKAQLIQSRAWKKIAKSIPQRKTPRLYAHVWSRIAVAAGLLLITSVAIYFFNQPSSVATNPSAHLHDIRPGTSRATLIASNGARYELNGSKQEIVIDRSSIHYTDGEKLADAQAGQNITLNTPKGGQYRVTLSDGTKVWLNAASSLSYPSNFTGKERKVKLEGEAYFEVAHNASHPFIVSTNEQQVKVLGTSFNVNAYANERKTVTTLLNGRVELSSSRVSATTQLHPGQQAVFDQSGFGVGAVDATLYAAWKDGEFRFKATPLIEALRQVERWYDLDIDYTGIPAGIQIHASISRNKQLSTVLHALEKISDLKFDVKGRRVKLMQ
ncbi:FecR family protein [Pedobacter sp. MC2016-24]|uniref:FecR family protein n=1 Tax=Pedobacter sp. MC2016-24 TaxID=2780090 RepID=UPI00187DDE69|nr:FecR family protein [Pedobacter sp. MC2016-24]MBE9599443.1 FecR domain-containing protein [Pedobacter sp. MC2016-24]